MADKPGTTRSFMSTEYRAKCVEWVLTGHAGKPVKASDMIEQAKAVYAYVYGESDASDANR